MGGRQVEANTLRALSLLILREPSNAKAVLLLTHVTHKQLRLSKMDDFVSHTAPLCCLAKLPWQWGPARI